MFARLQCALRSSHNPARHPLGGFRCVDCGFVGVDLDEMGFADGGYVLPTRRIFSRQRGELTRTQAWESSHRGW